jgi:peptidoglycan hydrolase CwlO-like protein
MIKNLYIAFTTIALGYLLMKEPETSVVTENIIDESSLRADSLKSFLTASDNAISTKIEKTTNTIVSLKEEVSELKGVIKQKELQINELKVTISEYTSNIGDKFSVLAASEEAGK